MAKQVSIERSVPQVVNRDHLHMAPVVVLVKGSQHVATNTTETIDGDLEWHNFPPGHCCNIGMAQTDGGFRRGCRSSNGGESLPKALCRCLRELANAAPVLSVDQRFGR